MSLIFGQLVIGPPGSGKTTYCYVMTKFLEKLGRKVAVINLDPANENMQYTPTVDISELIKHEEVMSHYGLGPNGALVYCMEFLEANIKWLITKVLNLKDHYLIFDCPGQVELYTHHNSVSVIAEKLGQNLVRLCSVHLVDSHHCSDAGSGWKILDGCEEGQTQESCDLYTNKPVWDHPIDVHYTTQTLQNSPKLLLQIFHRDTHGRILFGSYGVCNIPLSPGLHLIKCHTWKPIGNWKDRLRDKFLGITLQLKSPSVLVNSLDRFELLTESMGTVKIELHIIARNFEKYGCHI